LSLINNNGNIIPSIPPIGPQIAKIELTITLSEIENQFPAI